MSKSGNFQNDHSLVSFESTFRVRVISLIATKLDHGTSTAYISGMKWLRFLGHFSVYLLVICCALFVSLAHAFTRQQALKCSLAMAEVRGDEDDEVIRKLLRGSREQSLMVRYPKQEVKALISYNYLDKLPEELEKIFSDIKASGYDSEGNFREVSRLILEFKDSQNPEKSDYQAFGQVMGDLTDVNIDFLEIDLLHQKAQMAHLLPLLKRAFWVHVHPDTHHVKQMRGYRIQEWHSGNDIIVAFKFRKFVRKLLELPNLEVSAVVLPTGPLTSKICFNYNPPKNFKEIFSPHD